MKLTESKIWSYINKIQKQKKNWHFVRIESNTVNGIPDVNGVINGREYWIELKCNRGNNIGLSKYQLLWHSKRVQSGGKCFILHLTEKHEHIEILEVRDSRSRSRFPFPVLVSLVSYAPQPCSPVLRPGSRVRDGLEEAVMQMSRL